MSDKYYVIGRNCKTGGFFSIFVIITSYIIYAVENSYIPVVDLKNFENQYFKDDRQYKDNVWEYFFKQPCGIGLDDIPVNADIINSKESKYIESLRFLCEGGGVKIVMIISFGLSKFLKHLM